MAGPKYAKYIPLVLSVLRELGNSGTASEVFRIIAEKQRLPENDLSKRLKNRTSYFENQVAWARYYLAKAGFVGTSKRGVWTLTEKGIKAELNESDALKLWREVNQQLTNAPLTTIENDSINTVEDDIAPSFHDEVTQSDHKQKLLEIIRSLSPTGFEHICKRLLRESGFQEVEVTGRSGDNGIDGRGVLKINRLLSIQVLFQAKRYGADVQVTPSQIRDFRGAMRGRTDKGIFITTSYFAIGAQREASREGVEPIELVDGEHLIEMFEEYELGLKRRTVYDLEEGFFEEFKNR